MSWTVTPRLLGSLLVGALALGLGSCGRDRPVEPLSVLLLTVDTLRPDYMSRNGYDRPTTPFLDRLLADGLDFPQALTPIARTTPAIASLLTGAYPHTTGVRKLTDPLAEEVTTLPELLDADGYQTFAVVTNQLMPPARKLDRGFDVYDWAGDVRTAPETTSVALDHLDRVDPTRPLLAWVHYIDPHMPYHSDSQIAERFNPGYDGPYRHNFGWQPRPGQSDRTFRVFPKKLPKPIAVHRNPLPARVNAHIRRLYAADIRYLDDHVGPLVARMRELYGDRLLIVFTADHGESLGERDFYFDHGDYVYHAELRVPLNFILPEQHPMQRSGQCRGWVSLLDVAPTVLDLLGREVPPSMADQLEGRSLLPCWRGDSLEPRPLFAESGHSFYFDYVRRRQRNDVAGRFRAVTLGDWKLIWTPFLPPEEAWELYNLSRDPGETVNVYDAGHAEARRLQRLLADWLRRGDRTGSQAPWTEQDLEALRSLGYID